MADEYPENTVQWITGSWWTKSSDLRLCRGRLIHAFSPFVGAAFWTLEAYDRGGDGKDHSRALYRVSPCRVQDARGLSKLPVAALPNYDGEVYGVYRTKRRPLIVVSEPLVLPKGIVQGSIKWQTAPVVVCVPAFGVERSDKRAGWSPEFVERIQRVEYPNYVWDRLPQGGLAKGSIIRLDQPWAVGTATGSYEPTEWVLSESGRELMNDWIQWFLSGAPEPAGELLAYARKELAAR